MKIIAALVAGAAAIFTLPNKAWQSDELDLPDDFV